MDGFSRNYENEQVSKRVRWGESTSSDQLRASATCSKCGRKGATLQLPSHGGPDFKEQFVPIGGMRG